MLKKIAIIALSVAFAGPVAASDQIRQSLKVEPGEYTTHEMIQLMAAGGAERKQRFILIHKERKAFADAVYKSLNEQGVLSTAGIR